MDERRLDAQLMRVADRTASDLRVVAQDCTADEFAALVYSAALAQFRQVVDHQTFTALRRRYHDHQQAFFTHLRPHTG